MKYNTSPQTNSLKTYLRRRQRYLQHIKQLGIHNNDDIYKFFVREAFHDGKLTIEKLSLSHGFIDIRVRNVRALDIATSRLRTKKVKDSDFDTKIRFTEVRSFTYKINSSITSPIYHCSCIDILNNRYEIEILFEDRYQLSKSSCLKINCKNIIIENITSKISKYFESVNDARQALDC